LAAARSYCSGTMTTSCPACWSATGSPRDCSAPTCCGIDAQTWPRAFASMAAAISGSNVAATSSYWPASSRSSTALARSDGSCAQALVNANAANNARAKRSDRCVISDLLFQVGRGRLAGSPRDRDEFPALLAEFNQLIARGIGQNVAPPAGLDLDDLIRPFP